jgi:GYF domain 2
MARQWYYAKGGQQVGPVAFEEVRGLAAGGQLSRSDLVWTEGMAEWQPASKVPDLMPSAVAAAAPVPSPAPASAAPTIQIADAPAPLSHAAHPNEAYAPAPPVAAATTYAQPDYAPLSYASPGQGVVMASERSLEMLRQTRPWVRFISVLLLIVGALYAVFGVIGLVGAMATSSRNAPYMGGQMVAVAVVSVVYLSAAFYLGKYGTKIRDLLNNRRSEDLEAALDAQRSFWRLVGIMMIVGLGLVVVVLLIVAVGVARF